MTNGHAADCHTPGGHTPGARPPGARPPGGQEPGGAAPGGPATILLVGNPNVGKSTVFNAVTGARQRVVNAPGTTVELQVGTWRGVTNEPRIVDLPGTYSLLARTPDERVAAAAVAGEAGLGHADLVVVLLDAAALTRSLYLLAQVGLTRQPVVVAVTMADVATDRGVRLRTDALADRLGVPVVVVDPRAGGGIADLTATVDQVLTATARPVDIDVTPLPPDADVTAQIAQAEELFAWVQGVVDAVATTTAVTGRRNRSDRLDRLLLSPVTGVPIFLVVMWVLFQLVTTVAAPATAALGSALDGPVAHLLRRVIPGSTWVDSLAVDGVLAGVGAVAAFLAPMAMMFAAIALLEDSGYMARVAVVGDRAMRAIGLDGRAVLPFVVGFGCNVPAVAATRALPRAHQRLVATLLVPFTSCSARLTVYVLIATVFFPDNAGTVVFTLYVASIALVVLGGLVLKHTIGRADRSEPLLVMLPAYQRPRWRTIGASVLGRVGAFVRRGGKVIITTLVIVWLLMAIPVTGGTWGSVPVKDSLYGAVAQAVSPVLAPAGLGDWHVSAALATGVVAKEVVVASFAQTYAVTEPTDPSSPGDLGAQLRATFDRTSGGHPGAAAAAFMVFVLAYTPCVATVVQMRRVIGRRWTAGAVAAQIATAWLLAVLVFSVGRLW